MFSHRTRKKSTLSIGEVVNITLDVKYKLGNGNGSVVDLVKTKTALALKNNMGSKKHLKILSIINDDYETEQEDVNIT